MSRGNDFGLLDALGGDVAGALSLLPESVVPAAGRAPDYAPRLLDDHGLVDVLDALPTRPLLAGRDGLRLSLAGAQSKLPVVLVDGRVALPAPGQPTTHILKPTIARFPGTTENEALAMRLAAACGLPVAPVEARVAGGRPYVLVTRYDRRLASRWTRITAAPGRPLSSAGHRSRAEVCGGRRAHVQGRLRPAAACDDATGTRGARAPGCRDLQCHRGKCRRPRQELQPALRRRPISGAVLRSLVHGRVPWTSRRRSR